MTLRLTSLGRGRTERAAAEGLRSHKKGGSLGKAFLLASFRPLSLGWSRLTSLPPLEGSKAPGESQVPRGEPPQLRNETRCCGVL